MDGYDFVWICMKIICVWISTDFWTFFMDISCSISRV